MAIPATTRQGGLCFAFPDVCDTPTPGGKTPVPYPNLAQPNLAVNASTVVFVDFAPAVTMNSQIPMSSGDEAGVIGGVASGVFMGPATFSKGSSVVIVEGFPWVHLGSMTRQNGVAPNHPCGSVVAPSQATVFVAP